MAGMTAETLGGLNNVLENISLQSSDTETCCKPADVSKSVAVLDNRRSADSGSSLISMDENPVGKTTSKVYIRNVKATNLSESWIGPYKLIRIFNSSVLIENGTKGKINYVHSYFVKH